MKIKKDQIEAAVNALGLTAAAKHFSVLLGVPVYKGSLARAYKDRQKILEG